MVQTVDIQCLTMNKSMWHHHLLPPPTTDTQTHLLLDCELLLVHKNRAAASDDIKPSTTGMTNHISLT